MLKNIKKMKLKYFLVPNLPVFIISVFQKNSEFLKFSLQYGFLRYYLTTEKDLFIFIKKKKKKKKMTNNKGRVFWSEITLVANKRRIYFVYFVYDIFIFFLKLRLIFQLIVFISHVIFLENLNETKKWYSTETLDLF